MLSGLEVDQAGFVSVRMTVSPQRLNGHAELEWETSELGGELMVSLVVGVWRYVVVDCAGGSSALDERLSSHLKVEN